jgi:hypothetical protein
MQYSGIQPFLDTCIAGKTHIVMRKTAINVLDSLVVQSTTNSILVNDIRNGLSGTVRYNICKE